jgi:hypothetical protein
MVCIREKAAVIGRKRVKGALRCRKYVLGKFSSDIPWKRFSVIGTANGRERKKKLPQ